MEELPINDFSTKGAAVREGGRVMRDIHLSQVKPPAESRHRFDHYKLLATVPAEQPFRPLAEGGGPMVKGASVGPLRGRAPSRTGGGVPRGRGERIAARAGA